jgi:hypothetical protein
MTRTCPNEDVSMSCLNFKAEVLAATCPGLLLDAWVTDRLDLMPTYQQSWLDSGESDSLPLLAPAIAAILVPEFRVV